MMRSNTPSTPTKQSPNTDFTGCVADGTAPAQQVLAPPGPHATDEAEGMLKTLLAVGASAPEAMDQVAAAMGPPAASAIARAFTGHFVTPKDPSDRATVFAEDFLEACGRWEDVSPGMGTACLHAALVDGYLHPWEGARFPGYHFTGLNWLTSLPDGFDVQGSLFLVGLDALTVLPANLKVSESLAISRCIALTAIGDGLSAGDEVSIAECHALTALPRMDLPSHLTIENARSLATLPDGLRIGGDLLLSDCPSLKRLPAGLSVAGELRLEACGAWDQTIPSDASTGRIMVETDDDYDVPW